MTRTKITSVYGHTYWVTLDTSAKGYARVSRDDGWYSNIRRDREDGKWYADIRKPSGDLSRFAGIWASRKAAVEEVTSIFEGM